MRRFRPLAGSGTPWNAEAEPQKDPYPARRERSRGFVVSRRLAIAITPSPKPKLRAPPRPAWPGRHRPASCWLARGPSQFTASSWPAMVKCEEMEGGGGRRPTTGSADAGTRPRTLLSVHLAAPAAVAAALSWRRVVWGVEARSEAKRSATSKAREASRADQAAQPVEKRIRLINDSCSTTLVQIRKLIKNGITNHH